MRIGLVCMVQTERRSRPGAASGQPARRSCMATAPLQSGFAEMSSSRLRQPALVQRRAVARDPGVDAQEVRVDQVQPVQLGRERAAAEEHADRGRVFELLYAGAQVAADEVTIGPREARPRRPHHVLRPGLRLDRPLAHEWRRGLVAADDRGPVALHHLVGDPAPTHRAGLVHEAGEEGVRLGVGDSLPGARRSRAHSSAVGPRHARTRSPEAAQPATSHQGAAPAPRWASDDRPRRAARPSLAAAAWTRRAMPRGRWAVQPPGRPARAEAP